MNSWLKQWNPSIIKIVISFIIAFIGYISVIKSPEIKVKIITTYAFWSWFWGLVLLYPNYIGQVKSVKSTAVRAYSFIHYGAFYICQALLFGFLGGGAYRFIKECHILFKSR